MAAMGMLLIACLPAVTTSTKASSDVATEENPQPASARGYVFPPPPEMPEGELAPATSIAVDQLLASA